MSEEKTKYNSSRSSLKRRERQPCRCSFAVQSVIQPAVNATPPHVAAAERPLVEHIAKAAGYITSWATRYTLVVPYRRHAARAVYWQRHSPTTGRRRRCDHYYYCPIVTHSTTALPLIGIGEEDTLCTRASFKYDYYVLLQHHQVQNTNKLQHEQLHHSSLPSWNKMITSATAAAITLPAAFLDFRPMTVTAVQAIKVRKQFYSQSIEISDHEMVKLVRHFQGVAKKYVRL